MAAAVASGESSGVAVALVAAAGPDIAGPACIQKEKAEEELLVLFEHRPFVHWEAPGLEFGVEAMTRPLAAAVPAEENNFAAAAVPVSSQDRAAALQEAAVAATEHRSMIQVAAAADRLDPMRLNPVVVRSVVGTKSAVVVVAALGAGGGMEAALVAADVVVVVAVAATWDRPC